VGTDITGVPVRVFQRPACKEYINTSMTECRFCGSPVDYEAALAGATLKEKIDQACDQADTIYRTIWFLPLFCWACGIWVYASWRDLFLIPLGFAFLPVIALTLMLLWPYRFWGIQAADPDFENAKRRVRISFWIWVLGFPVPLIIISLVKLLTA
jgi:hypothetical protein